MDEQTRLEPINVCWLKGKEEEIKVGERETKLTFIDSLVCNSHCTRQCHLLYMKFNLYIFLAR